LTEELAGEVRDILQSRTPAVLATVVASAVAEYPAGLKSVLHAGGRADPGLPAGPLAEAIRRDARQALSTDGTRLISYSPTGAAVERRGAAAVRVFLEPLAPVDRLVIVGAGHIAVPICQIAAVLGFEVTVLDDRSDYANEARFPEATSVIAADFAGSLAGIPIDSSTYVILVTRAHAFDEAALAQIATGDARYIGMIGSRRRVLIVYQNLIERGVPAAALGKVHAPLGVDIGSETVEEIALAAMAEIINVKRGGAAKSLRIAEWRGSPAGAGKDPD
jgi:xanthine dehydrogenase accessory factor